MPEPCPTSCPRTVTVLAFAHPIADAHDGRVLARLLKPRGDRLGFKVEQVVHLTLTAPLRRRVALLRAVRAAIDAELRRIEGGPTP